MLKVVGVSPADEPEPPSPRLEVADELEPPAADVPPGDDSGDPLLLPKEEPTAEDDRPDVPPTPVDCSPVPEDQDDSPDDHVRHVVQSLPDDRQPLLSQLSGLSGLSGLVALSALESEVSAVDVGTADDPPPPGLVPGPGPPGPPTLVAYRDDFGPSVDSSLRGGISYRSSSRGSGHSRRGSSGPTSMRTTTASSNRTRTASGDPTANSKPASSRTSTGPPQGVGTGEPSGSTASISVLVTGRPYRSKNGPAKASASCRVRTHGSHNRRRCSPNAERLPSSTKWYRERCEGRATAPLRFGRS